MGEKFFYKLVGPDQLGLPPLATRIFFSTNYYTSFTEWILIIYVHFYKNILFNYHKWYKKKIKVYKNFPIFFWKWFGALLLTWYSLRIVHEYTITCSTIMVSNVLPNIARNVTHFKGMMIMSCDLFVLFHFSRLFRGFVWVKRKLCYRYNLQAARRDNLASYTRT